jgi:hypothetical protein
LFQNNHCRLCGSQENEHCPDFAEGNKAEKKPAEMQAFLSQVHQGQAALSVSIL